MIHLVVTKSATFADFYVLHHSNLMPCEHYKNVNILTKARVRFIFRVSSLVNLGSST